MNMKTLGVGLIAVAAMLAIGSAYFEGRDRDSPVVASVRPDAASAAPAVPAAQPPAEDTAFTHYRVDNAAARAIHVDGSVLWVGTTVGLIRFDTRSGEHRYFSERDGLKSQAVLHVASHAGRIVLGTNGGGLAFFDQSRPTWEHYGVAEGLPDARVFSTLHARNGDLWLATWAGVIHMPADSLAQRDRWRHYTRETTKGALPGNRVYALAEQANGAIWAAAQGGVARYQNGKWTNWRGAGEAAAADAVAVTIARDGIVWIGTLDSGLAAFDGKRWRAFGKAEGLPGSRIFALHEDAQGQLWIGTDKGLVRRAEGRFSALGPDDGLVGSAVFSVAAPADGTLWVGGNGGVAHIRRYALHDLR